MSRIAGAVGLIGVVACSGGGAPAAGGAEPGGGSGNAGPAPVSCERMVDAMIRWSARDAATTVAALEADMPGLRAQGVEACERDREHRRFACVATAPDDDAAVDACLSKAKAGYMGDAPKTEAELQLTRLGKAAKAYFVENGAFATQAAALTPNGPCCNAGGQCRPDAAPWAQPPWSAMEFSIDDAHMFQYAYEGDATRFLATAVGDTNCDGKPATYEVRGEVVDGLPVLGEIVKIGAD